MTKQTEIRKRLGGSPAGASVARLCGALTLAAIFVTGGVVAGLGQVPPESAKPAKQVTVAGPSLAASTACC